MTTYEDAMTWDDGTEIMLGQTVVESFASLARRGGTPGVNERSGEIVGVEFDAANGLVLLLNSPGTRETVRLAKADAHVFVEP